MTEVAFVSIATLFDEAPLTMVTNVNEEGLFCRSSIFGVGSKSIVG